ncbi:MAG: bifunctional riboflavin kinase/FAD synthetase [Micrococcaceae bacterium]
MRGITNLDELADKDISTCIAIGNFDGVHRGHQYILGIMLKKAAEKNLSTLALTFSPHPIEFHHPEINFQHITTAKQKLREFENLGIDYAVIIDYCAELAAMSAEEFCKEVLIDKLHAQVIVVGEDFTFGRDRSGNIDTLRELGNKYDFETVALADHGIPNTKGKKRRLSSTWLRESLADGDVSLAAKILGRYHSVEGKVVHGAARGRELGFPTANLQSNPSGLIPADGVYAGWLHIGKSRYPAAISIGTNPTFKGIESRQVEAHVINRPVEDVSEFDLYGRYVRIEFVERLRGMVAYTGVKKLVEQMNYDIAKTERILSDS